MYESHIETHFEANFQQNKSSIEYFLVNLPDCLQHNPTKFLQVMVEFGTNDYFESLAVQTIINFKWEKYTRDYFIK